MNRVGVWIRLFIGMASICLLLMGLALWAMDPWHFSAPTDDQLNAMFKGHQKIFEKLAKMTNEDSPKEWYFSLRNLNNGLGDARKELYKDYIEQIDPKLVIRVSQGYVVFCFAGGGISAVGPEWSKGIVYFPQGRGPRDDWKVSSQLDELNHLDIGYYVKPIEKGWFIIYENIP